MPIQVRDANNAIQSIATVDDLIEGLAAQMYQVAGTGLTRPANTTPYDIGDSISNHATAGSVTANVVALADENDAMFTIERIKLETDDTGPRAVEALVEMMLFNSDPTADSGVGAGDNASYTQKRAGCIGIFTGTFRESTGYFSDGSVAWLAPASAGEVRVIAKPGTGTKNIWWQIKTLSAFTPSDDSTIWTPTFEGFYGRL